KRILGLGRLRLRGPTGANDEFLLAATAQNLRKLFPKPPPPEPALQAAVRLFSAPHAAARHPLHLSPKCPERAPSTCEALSGTAPGALPFERPIERAGKPLGAS
ncbi:MAG: hypothetical protein AAFU49_11740, partial [Pseudomonadota bacterium]